MMSKRIDKRLATGLALVGVVSAVGLVGGFAQAATPSTSDGQIYGCYRNSASLTDAKGALRIIDKDASQTCTGSESALKWSPAGNTIGTVRKDAAGANLSGLEFRNRDMRGISFAGTNFNSATLNNDDFGGVNLSGASLVGTILINPSFKGANFTGATISHIYLPDIRVYSGEPGPMADFSNANFSNATLDKLDAPGPTWSYDFRGSNFTGATLKTFLASAQFSGIDFRNTHFVPGDFGITGFVDSDLSYTNFSNMTIDSFSIAGVNADLTHANFRDTTFTNFNTNSTRVADDADFTNSDIDTADLNYAHLDRANFTGVKLKDAEATYAFFDSTDFTNARFENVDFTYSDLTNTILTGVTWINVTCPDGVNSGTVGNTCTGHLVHP